jgi:hypothetical protein
VLSPTLFNIYMSDIPKPPDNVDLETYADDMTTMSSNKDVSVAEQNLQPYLNELFEWTQANDLQLNPSKSTSTLFTTDPSEYNRKLNLTINNTEIPTIKHPKILGLTFDPKLNFQEHIKITKEKANKTINMMKALTSTKWGKQKETLLTTYKTITRPIIEYANTIWAPIAKDTNVDTLQTVQNASLRIATGCTRDTSAIHLHEETKILPIKEHLKLHCSQLRQKTQLPAHPLHSLTQQKYKSRQMKQTIFRNDDFTTNYDVDPTKCDEAVVNHNKKLIHADIVNNHIQKNPLNKLTGKPTLEISPEEQKLPRETRRILAQLRTNKSPILFSYKNKIDKSIDPLCRLCKTEIHDTYHLFNCKRLFSSKTIDSLWNSPSYVESLLSRWRLMGGLA